MIVIPGSFTLLHLASDAESGGLKFITIAMRTLKHPTGITGAATSVIEAVGAGFSLRIRGNTHTGTGEK